MEEPSFSRKFAQYGLEGRWLTAAMTQDGWVDGEEGGGRVWEEDAGEGWWLTLPATQGGRKEIERLFFFFFNSRRN